MSKPPLPPLDVAEHLDLLARALEEDHARRDVTTHAVVRDDRAARAVVVAKAVGVLAGLPLVLPCFRLLDADATVESSFADGARVAPGDVVLEIGARARAILSAERTALNLLGHLSGIATLTRRFVDETEGTRAIVLDTRKTTPGLRHLEKYAVACGGGVPHRMDLEDAAMIKENHLYAAFGRTGPDSIREAVRRCRAALAPGRTLCCEVENLEELDAAVEAGADVVMLDGFDLDDVRRAVARVEAKGVQLEVTGGVDLSTVRAIAATGVDRMSSGALTHSAPGLDLSLRVLPG
jgi:nicotinate-nucleotide pyrophosphorylase (carboxylating)